MVKIKLNDLGYRYDIYQIVSLFYPLSEINFVDEGYDFNIEVNKSCISIAYNGKISQFEIDNSFTVKENVKKRIFNYLSSITGRELPWGTLVGIRPSKIALGLLEEDKSEEDIIAFFQEHYETRVDKTKLCIDVAKVEREVVNKESKKIAVYLDMPFCPTRCLYCSFTSNPIGTNKSLVEEYLKALVLEIEALGKYIDNKNLEIESVYFGGGTPTSVNDQQFQFIMEVIYSQFIKDKNTKEFTVECGRPDSISSNKLQCMKNYEVTRISINPQTMNNETLKRIGRNHSVEEVIEKFNLARSLNFDNINMDLIVGLPGETLKELKNTCEHILKLKPDSLTIHGMTVKRASKLNEYRNLLKIDEIDSKELNAMYEKTVELSKELRMKAYYMYRQKNMIVSMENVGYSMNQKECIYNIQMIEEKQTIIALGADAVSKVIFLSENRIERFANVKDVREYIKRIDEMIKKKIDLLDTLYCRK